MVRAPALALVLAAGCAPPATHVLVSGDSISGGGGYTWARMWPHILSGLLREGVTDEAYPGFRVAQMKEAYEHGPRGRFSDCLTLGGVNDFGNGNDSATVFATVSALADEEQADGCFVHVIRPLPWRGGGYWSEEKQAQADAYWALMLDYCAKGAAVCHDASALVGDGTTPPALNPGLDSGDHVHPNQDGESVLAVAAYHWLTPDWPSAMGTTPSPR